MTQKIKITKGNVQETLLLPLWGRAYETQKNDPRLRDEKAVEIIKKIDYDFSVIEKTQAMSQHGWVARSLHTDKMVLDFIQKHPKATLVNIGCGLDTTFSRVDNGMITFYELDLPDVIELRRNFYEDSERHISIASSFLDTGWFKEINVVDGLLFLSGGVFYYFDENKIKNFFKAVADHFGNCDFYFDSLSPLGVKIGKKMVLKNGGINIFMGDGWALKSAKSLEKWDKRIKVLSTRSMSKGIKVESFGAKLILMIPDLLGVCSMVHMRISDKLL